LRHIAAEVANVASQVIETLSHFREKISQALFQQGQPAAMFYTDYVKGDYERIKARGAEFTMPPTDVTASTIAMLNDTCGNLIQLTQLAR